MLKQSVFLEGLKLHVRCGVYEEERTLGVQVEVSVKITSEKFVDYRELHDTILKVAKERVFVYLEDFAVFLLGIIRKKWEADSVIIEIAKVSVPFQHSFKRVGIELIWESDGKREERNN
jgi:dihydroneopterin aldolase